MILIKDKTTIATSMPCSKAVHVCATANFGAANILWNSDRQSSKAKETQEKSMRKLKNSMDKIIKN